MDINVQKKVIVYEAGRQKFHTINKVQMKIRKIDEVTGRSCFFSFETKNMNTAILLESYKNTYFERK